VHEARPGLDGALVVLEVHEVGELGLAGQVEVVGAARRAGRNHRLTEPDVGPDRRDEHPGALGERAHRSLLVDVDGDGLDVTTEPGAHLVELGRAAPGDGQPRRGRCVGGQVVGDQAPREPGGAEQGHVEVALVCHRATLVNSLPAILGPLCGEAARAWPTPGGARTGRR